MKSKLVILFGSFCLMVSQIITAEELGTIGRKYEGGLPVVYKFVNELPSSEERTGFAWLVIVSWKYDGANNNGMPSEDDNENMIRLEKAIEEDIENNDIFRHAYSRTGNNLKEFVYYISSQEEFMSEFNSALERHARYPIEINFYEDKNWQNFSNLLSDFSKIANKK